MLQFHARRLFLPAFFTVFFVAQTVVPQDAAAAPITRTFEFAASGLSNVPPTDPVTGSFTVTFDPTVVLVENQSGVVTNSLNIASDGATVFSYNGINDLLFIGGNNFATSITNFTNDFWIRIDNASTAMPIGAFFTYCVASGCSPSTYSTTTVEVILAETPVPAPAAAAILGLCAAGLIGLRARRRRAA